MLLGSEEAAFGSDRSFRQDMRSCEIGPAMTTCVKPRKIPAPLRSRLGFGGTYFAASCDRKGVVSEVLRQTLTGGAGPSADLRADR